MRMLCVLAILLGTSLSQAQRADFIKNNTFVSTLSSDSAMRAGQTSFVNSEATRIAGLQDLFGMENVPFENNGLSWPPLPRYWGQEGYTNYFEARFGIGLPPGTPIVSASATSTYKYEVTTTFHYLGTLKFLGRDSSNALNELLPNEFERVFVRDYVTLQEFFNVSQQNPIVGMCQFEIALYHGVSASGGVSFVLSAIAEGGRVNFSRMSVYSRMFNLRTRGPSDEYSASWYLNNECSDRFRKYVRPFVEDALAFKAQQYNAEFHPYNTCEHVRPVPNQTDRDCKDWHDGVGIFNFRKPVSTVGRCEMQGNGESHCVLKSKEGQKCTLYYADGRDTMTLNLDYLKRNQIPPFRPLTSRNTGPYSMATSGVREYPCDAGLTCTMDNPDYGIATCKRLVQRDRQ